MSLKTIDFSGIEPYNNPIIREINSGGINLASELSKAEKQEKIREIMKTRVLLLVEDEKIMSEFLISALKKLLQNVIWAENGKEGLREYKEHKPDMILTDINMPKMNGMEMLKQIRDEDTHTPIMVYSAKIEQLEELEEGYRSQINYALSKPIDFLNFQLAVFYVNYLLGISTSREAA